MSAPVWLPEAFEFQIGPGEMDAFRNLSGDDNPLHSDRQFACARGFDGPVVYGGLIVAQVSRLLGTSLPGPGCVWRSLTLKFRNALYVDEPATLTAAIIHSNVELGFFQIAIRVEANGRRIAEGEARATLMQERATVHV